MASKNSNKNKSKNNQQLQNKSVHQVNEQREKTRIETLNETYNSILTLLKDDSVISNKELERLNSFTDYRKIYNFSEISIRCGATGLTIFNSKFNAEYSNHERTKQVYDGLMITLQNHISDYFNSSYSTGQIKVKGTGQTLTYLDFCAITDADKVKDFTMSFFKNDIEEYEIKHFETLIKLVYNYYVVN